MIMESTKEDLEKTLLIPVVPVGLTSITRAKEIKEALSRLIQELMDKKNIQNSFGDVSYQVQPILSLLTSQESPKGVT